MAVRSGMADVIQYLRGLTNAGTADWTRGTVVHWDDTQLQLVLDRHRVEVLREHLDADLDYVGGGTIEYKTFRSRYEHLEATTGGTEILWIEDSIGDNRGTADWTPDYNTGVFVFGADQGGTALFLTGRSYDVNGAAAEVWNVKASKVAEQFDFATDNHRVQIAKIFDHYLSMHQHYKSLSVVSGHAVTIRERGDMVADDWVAS